MKRVLPNLCVCFCLGIVVANYLKVPLLIFYIATVISLVLSLVFRNKRIFMIFILFSVFALGACLLRNYQLLPASHISNFTPYKGRYVYLKGTVDNDPILKKNKTTFVLKTEDVLINRKLHKVGGRVLVTAYGRSDFNYGEKLILNGKLYKPFNFNISERLNYRDYLKNQGIYSLLSLKKDSFVKRFEGNYGNPIKTFAYLIKHKMRKIVSDNLSESIASVLNAMLFGERKEVPQFINDSLRCSGTIHILAVSGFNVGIVAFIMMVFLKVIRIPRKPRFIITMALLVVYAILTGAGPSIIRATVMILILLVGYLIQRESDIYNSLSFAALIILLVNPNQFFDIGFQLSFASVLSIVWISPKIKKLFSAKWYRNSLLRFILTAFCVSSAAWLGTIGLVAYYFKILTPISILANVIILPFVTIITAAGFTLVIAGGLSTFLASLIAPACALLLAIMFKVNSLLISIPGAYFNLPLLSFYLIGIYYVIIFILFKYLRLFRIA